MGFDSETALLTMECVSLVVGLLVEISCLLSRRQDVSAQSFIMLTMTLSIALLVDILSILLQEYDDWHMLLSTMMYLMGYVTLVIYTRFQMRVFKPEGSIEWEPFLLAVELSAVVAAGLMLANLHYGWFFTISHHEYVRGPMYSLVLLYVMTILILNVGRLAIKRSGDAQMRRELLLYSLLPLLAWMAQYFLPIRLIFTASMLSVWIVYVRLYLHSTNLLAEREKELAYERMNVMVSQIQPHFMFNTLSNIRALCRKDPERALWAIDRFSECLRGNMAALDATEPMPFAKEMQQVSSYLDIEQLRFPKTLHVAFDLSVMDFAVPPLSVQTLVENAVRHGITKKAGGGTVKVSSYEDRRYDYVEIQDDGVGFDVHATQEGTHVGLENTRQRLHLMCNGRLEVHSQIGKGTTVKMIIPKGGIDHARYLRG